MKCHQNTDVCVHFRVVCLWLLSHTAVEWNVAEVTVWPTKPKVFIIWLLQNMFAESCCTGESLNGSGKWCGGCVRGGRPCWLCGGAQSWIWNVPWSPIELEKTVCKVDLFSDTPDIQGKEKPKGIDPSGKTSQRVGIWDGMDGICSGHGGLLHLLTIP